MTNSFLLDLAIFEKKRVWHPAAKTAVDQIEAMIESSGIVPNPESVLVAGESRAGKTAIAEHLTSKHPRYYEKSEKGDQLIVPAFYCKTPSPVRIVDFADAMFRQLGKISKKSYKDPTQALVEDLLACRTSIVFIDEIHHLMRHQGEKRTEEVRDWIKNLLDAIQIPVVFLGLPKCDPFIRTYEQLDARISSTIFIPSFEIPTSEECPLPKTIKALRTQLAELLDMRIASSMTNLEISKRFCLATGGRIGRIRPIIKNAAVMAHKGNLKEIGSEILSNVFSLAPPSTAMVTKANPFKISAAELENEISKIREQKLNEDPKRRPV